jgi:hypothetical protein
MLCDAFKNGGTMEIRFDEHPEGGIPASLRRFARARGITIGEDDPGAISPIEARALFLAVTPMRHELRKLSHEFCEHGGVSPERFCYMLSKVWGALELEFLVASTSVASSILSGRCNPLDRVDYQSILSACRSALMLGMLDKRLRNPGTPDAEEALEDERADVSAYVDGTGAVVRFVGVDSVPWGRDGLPLDGEIWVRPAPLGCIETLEEDEAALCAPQGACLLVPADVEVTGWEGDVLRCPATTSELDRTAAGHLDEARTGRK